MPEKLFPSAPPPPITPSENAYEKLVRESRYQAHIFGTILSATADFNYIFNREGRFIFINRALLTLLQKSEAEVLGRNFHELPYPPELATRLQHQIETVFVTGQPLKDDTPYVDPSGRIGHYEYIFVPVLGSDGTVEAVAGSTRDISEHKRVQQELRESETRFRQLADAMPQIVWITRADGYHEYYNKRWYEYTGRDFNETKGEGWNAVFHPDDQAGAWEKWRHSLETGEPYEIEYRARRHDGQYRWFLGRALPIRNSEGVIVNWFGTCTDIEEQKTLRQDLEQRVAERTSELRQKEQELAQAQKLEALGRLSGGVAHDFNNLVTGILGITEDVRNQLGAESPFRGDLEEVLKAGQKASALTKQLLAFGRRQVSAQRIFNVNTLIKDMHRLFQRVLREDIEVKTSLDPCLGNIKADYGHIEQVILNLAINARDAMPRGGRIQIETANVDLGQDFPRRRFGVPPGPYLLLTVSDTGTGIAPEILDNIFEPFFTTKEQGKGTGLGLATVYGIVKQNDGDISVSSVVGQGTTFRIYLPRVPEEAMVDRRGPKRGMGPGGSETVLVVEDEEIVRRVAVKALEKRGYRVLQAASGAEAFKILEGRQAPIDLLVTDVVMPEMNGRELASRLVTKQPGLSVLFMSGHPQDIILDRGVLEPGIAFIEKSFTVDGFCRKVREVLDKPRPGSTGSERKWEA